MKSIVEIAEGFYADLLDIIAGGGEWTTLEQLILVLESFSNRKMCECIETIVGMLSDAFFECPERREEEWTVKSRNGVKSILTPFGVVELRNDIYRIPESLRKTGEYGEGQKYTSPVLRQLGVDAHERIDKVLEGRLLNNALDMSYEKSAQMAAGGEVTRQTVLRILRRTPDVEMFNPPEEPKKVAVLDILIDEAHPKLQHDPEGRKSTIQPLGVIFEGRYEERKGRMRLKEPVLFVNKDMDSAKLLETMQAYVETTYDQSVLEKIRVHGDGAQWIRKAFRDSPFEVEHALDGFHLEREKRRLAGRLFTTKKQQETFRKELTEAMEKGDEETFFETLDKYVNALDEGNVKKNCLNSRRYIKNNWESAVARQKKETPGSATEAMVQHALAGRINGHSWAPVGAGKIGMFRVARANGVDICHPKPEELQPGKYIELCQTQLEDFKRTPADWSIFDHEHYPADGNSGTQHLLRLIALGGHREAV